MYFITYLQAVEAMFNYMADSDGIKERSSLEIEASGDDLSSLLFDFMTNWLSDAACCNYFIPKRIVIEDFDASNFKIRSVGYGEPFDREKHTQGTEVKAITYSAMKIHDELPTNDIYVIVDI
ncbi:Protein archease [Cichlidogyrus casuarinus]|uniref:Protein archease n=1 Tax=Cichlidogyrus casuarinus TaxID=1844966 RepID=A0ABD2Q199_9PLAT